jgi:hypothetical protein
MEIISFQILLPLILGISVKITICEYGIANRAVFEAGLNYFLNDLHMVLHVHWQCPWIL